MITYKWLQVISQYFDNCCLRHIVIQCSTLKLVTIHSFSSELFPSNFLRLDPIKQKCGLILTSVQHSNHQPGLKTSCCLVMISRETVG